MYTDVNVYSLLSFSVEEGGSILYEQAVLVPSVIGLLSVVDTCTPGRRAIVVPPKMCTHT